MKLTKTKLKQIIKEEITIVLNEVDLDPAKVGALYRAADEAGWARKRKPSFGSGATQTIKDLVANMKMAIKGIPANLRPHYKEISNKIEGLMNSAKHINNQSKFEGWARERDAILVSANEFKRKAPKAAAALESTLDVVEKKSDELHTKYSESGIKY